MKKDFIKGLLFVFLVAVLTTASYNVTKSMFIRLEVNKVSPITIHSPQAFTFVDEKETDKQKKQILSEVQAVYEKDDKIAQEQVNKLQSFLDSVIRQKTYYENDLKNAKKKESEDDKKEMPDLKTYIAGILNPYEFTYGEKASFFNAEIKDLTRIKEVFSKELENFYSAGITKEKLEEQKIRFINDSVFYHYDPTLRNLLLKKISEELKPNLILNEEETKKKQEEALKNLTPVTIIIQRGERIVGEGEVITEKQYEILKAAGLINKNFNFKESIEKFPFVLLTYFLLYMFMARRYAKPLANRRLYIFAITVPLLATFFVNLFQSDYVSYGLLVLFLIVITTFLGSKISLIYAITLGLLMHPGDYEFLSMATVLGVVQTFIYNPKGDRNSIINAGLILGLALVAAKNAMQLIIGLPLSSKTSIPLMVSSLGGAFLSLGLFAVLEKVLGVVTSLRLHELSGHNNELYRRLNNEAPGTLQHSLRVGNLAEAAADAIGANGLLLKVGAIYHDVGKLMNPTYFVENLIDTNIENPHNHLTPKESAAIIRQHPIDSVKLCRKYKIPEEIISLIEKHHGDSLVKYFYLKQLKTDPENTNIEDFKYQTPLPETKEEGILMLADVTEAASRSIMYEEPEIFKEKLTEIIQEKINEGQLRKCELTMKEINVIIDVFFKQLIPANHKRPKYPNQN